MFASIALRQKAFPTRDERCEMDRFMIFSKFCLYQKKKDLCRMKAGYLKPIFMFVLWWRPLAAVVVLQVQRRRSGREV